MAKIRSEDIARVRDAARIEEVVGDVVTLKPAGGGSWKGLCPFHEERTPSFHVTPAKGFYHCFGCQEGGDVIDFVMKTDLVGFAEAVEKLAARYGVELHYEQGGPTRAGQQGKRTRLVAAHAAAADFYRGNLQSPQAQPAREFLSERGFDDEAVALFGVGFAPPGWDGLTGHLRARGFTDEELIEGGLGIQGRRGVYDRFRGRLVWPIRDLSGEVIGFGARRVLPDDEGPKYLNTPETPLYRKSQVLYGVDLARKDIARSQQAVIVEGYTDVMACHLAGVRTAVATCGTAFGVEHVKVLRRLLLDQDEHRGEVIFTFDGDEAGRKAAMRAFEVDQHFVSRTFVAVTSDGMDPCDLRLARGDQAVRDLVAARIPLVEFVLRSRIEGFDLDTPEGRTNALRSAAPVLDGISDRILRGEYVRLAAGWIGVPQSAVTQALGGRRPGPAVAPQAPEPGGLPPQSESHDPAGQVERESLKLCLQYPELVCDWFGSVQPEAYTVAAFGRVYAAIVAAGGPPPTVSPDWPSQVLQACPDDTVRTAVRALSVEPPRALYGDAEAAIDQRFSENVLARLLELDAGRRLADVKTRLQRINPLEEDVEYRRLFSDVLALESYRRQLRDILVGET